MQEQNTPETPRRRQKKQNSKSILIIIVVVLLLTGAAVLLFNGKKTDTEPAPFEPLETAPAEPVVKETTVEQPVPETGIISEEETQSILPGEPEEEPGVEETVAETPEDKKARECQVLAEQIHGFFTHIDSEDYMQQFKLPQPSQEYFIALANKLLKNPPVVSRESDDLYTILKNMAHFFRVIGKDNIILIKTILDRERDKIEDVAAEFYQWTAWGDCQSELLQFSPSLEEMYEYAGFFLNTMGGRSYLFRRDSRSRLLVNYYSVLLIERANKNGVNRHGIDITQIIPQLVQEVEASNQLIYKENYIDSLYELLEKYQ